MLKRMLRWYRNALSDSPGNKIIFILYARESFGLCNIYEKMEAEEQKRTKKARKIATWSETEKQAKQHDEDQMKKKVRNISASTKWLNFWIFFSLLPSILLFSLNKCRS